MPKNQKATEIVTDKLWITYNENGVKTGLLSPATDDDEWLIHRLSNGETIAYEKENISEIFLFESKAENMDISDDVQVFGYPVRDIEIFQIQNKDGYPCFAKTLTSNILYAAGYYGINFDNGGWMDSFCPKLSTLKKYEHIGPFRSNTDATIAIKRKI